MALSSEQSLEIKELNIFLGKFPFTEYQNHCLEIKSKINEELSFQEFKTLIERAIQYPFIKAIKLNHADYLRLFGKFECKANAEYLMNIIRCADIKRFIIQDVNIHHFKEYGFLPVVNEIEINVLICGLTENYNNEAHKTFQKVLGAALSDHKNIDTLRFTAKGKGAVLYDPVNFLIYLAETMPKSQIKNLVISNVDTFYWGKDMAASFFAALKKAPCLNRLGFIDCRIRDYTYKLSDLFSGLSGTKIKILDLTNSSVFYFKETFGASNNISESEAEKLGTTLKHLDTLILDDNLGQNYLVNFERGLRGGAIRMLSCNGAFHNDLSRNDHAYEFLINLFKHPSLKKLIMQNSMLGSTFNLEENTELAKVINSSEICELDLGNFFDAPKYYPFDMRICMSNVRNEYVLFDKDKKIKIYKDLLSQNKRIRLFEIRDAENKALFEHIKPLAETNKMNFEKEVKKHKARATILYGKPIVGKKSGLRTFDQHRHKSDNIWPIIFSFAGLTPNNDYANGKTLIFTRKALSQKPSVVFQMASAMPAVSTSPVKTRAEEFQNEIKARYEGLAKVGVPIQHARHKQELAEIFARYGVESGIYTAEIAKAHYSNAPESQRRGMEDLVVDALNKKYQRVQVNK